MKTQKIGNLSKPQNVQRVLKKAEVFAGVKDLQLNMNEIF